MAIPADRLPATDLAVVRATYSQSPIGLYVFDREFRLLRYYTATPEMQNFPAEQLLGLTPGTWAPDIVGEDLERAFREVVETGEPRLGLHAHGVAPGGGAKRVLSISAFPMRSSGSETVVEVAVAVLDITEQGKARTRMEVLYRGGMHLGETLNVSGTGQELADIAVSGLADTVTVDILDCVLHGGLPRRGPVLPDTLVRRNWAGAPEGLTFPSAFPVGGNHGFPFSGPWARALDDGRPRLLRELTDADGQLPVMLERSLAPHGARSAIIVPLVVRGTILGLASFYRRGAAEPFTREDLSTAVALCGWAAMATDNARRYIRERTAARLLQRSLVATRLPSISTVDTASVHIADSGNAWCEVVPLSGARTALVVGDIAAHGVEAAAHMGQLRATVLALSDLELEPGELLTRLASLSALLAADAAEHPDVVDTPPSTCLYLVYDPSDDSCVAASAGHPTPLIGAPGGELTPAPPFVGPRLDTANGHVYESARFDVPENGLLALYTPGLTSLLGGDPDHRTEILRASLFSAAGSLRERCDRVVEGLLPRRPCGDAVLLLARTHALPARDIASWEWPTDPAIVGPARQACGEQLASWGLPEMSFPTELVVSELVTNAIRYGKAPVRVRLIRDQSLVVEVMDAGTSAPHIRHATSRDEKGRGLFLVDQLSARWGVRFDVDGKTVWVEQNLFTADEPPD